MSTNRDSLGELVRVVGRRSPPPHEDYQYVFAAARKAWEEKLLSRRRRNWLLALAAAITMFAVSIATFRHWLPRNPPVSVASTQVLHGTAAMRIPDDDTWRPVQVGTTIPPGARLRTASRAGLALKLAQGHSLRIDEQSELALESPEVLRLYSGAVYVDSGSRPPSPALRIDANFGTVRDIGTIFEVRAAPDALRVRVREGRVQLQTSARKAELESEAGQEIVVNDRGSVRRSRVSATEKSWAWAESLAVTPELDGQPLLQFLKWVARETGRNLQFEEPGLEAQAREVILHGRTQGLSPLDALDLMLSTTDLEYVLPSEELIVIRRRHG